MYPLRLARGILIRIIQHTPTIESSTDSNLNSRLPTSAHPDTSIPSTLLNDSDLRQRVVRGFTYAMEKIPTFEKDVETRTSTLKILNQNLQILDGRRQAIRDEF